MQKPDGQRSKFFTDFSKSARRRFLTFAMGATLLTSCSQSPLRAQMPVSPDQGRDNIEAVETPRSANVNSAPLVPAQDSVQHAEEVRRILMTDAANRFPELADKARTEYSAQLDSLEQHLRDYLKQDTSRHNNIIVLDPIQIDVANALGVPHEIVVLADVLKDTPAEQIRMDKPPVPVPVIMGAADNMSDPYRSKVGIFSYTQTASAFPNQTEAESRPCLIVPMSDHALPFTIKGLTFDQKTEYGNTHEGWHCLDNKYRLTAQQMAVLDTVSLKDFAAVKGNADAIAAGSSIHAMEMLADVASIGDMIRRGHDPKIIDAVIDWRTENTPSDFLHYSVPALQALKTHIAGTGLDTFRSTSHSDARDLYIRLTDENMLTPARFATALEYLTGDSMTRARLQVESAENDDTRRAVAYAKIMTPDPMSDLIRSFGRAITPADTTLVNNLQSWDFVAVLENEAMAVGGAITPASVIEAYGNVQDSLRRAITPENEVEQREKMTLMKTFFVNYVRKVDYVEANARHGVDIEVAAKDILAAGRAAAELPPNVIRITPKAPQPDAAPAANINAAPKKTAACGCGVARKPG